MLTAKHRSTSFWRLLREEFRSIIGDDGVLLVLLFAPFIYSTLYALGYGNEVLREIPIAVIDHDHTTSSRRLCSQLDATPEMAVKYGACDIEQARQLLYDRKIEGAIFIPDNYEELLLRGEAANVSIYCDASYFLPYRELLKGATATLSTLGTEVAVERLTAAEAIDPLAAAEPIVLRQHNLFNPNLGYGIFIMPAILIVILQQTALVGLGIAGGTRRERLRNTTQQGNTLSRLIARLVATFATYAFTALCLFTLHYVIFGYPTNGSVVACVTLLTLYLLASILLGISLAALFSHRESALAWLLWSSVPILLVSGVSLPPQALPHWLYTLGKALPSSSAVEGYIRLQTMGASLGEITPELSLLGLQTFLFGITSYIAVRCRG